MGDWTGTVPTILAGDAPTGDDWDSITDELSALSGSWTDFSSSFSWTASVSNPALVNAVLVARYQRVGKTVDYLVQITMGSSTTYGSGFYSFNVPATALSTAPTGSCMIFQHAVGQKSATAFFNTTSTVCLVQGTALVTNTSPMTWAATDILQFSIRYETA